MPSRYPAMREAGSESARDNIIIPWDKAIRYPFGYPTAKRTKAKAIPHPTIGGILPYTVPCTKDIGSPGNERFQPNKRFTSYPV